MIELLNVTKKFGDFTAVNSLNLTIKTGEILGLLGPNGAGKTTTMRMITGFFPHSEGDILIDGKNVFDGGIDIKKKIGYLPESNPLYYDMRVIEYLTYVGKLKKIKDVKKSVDNVIDKTGLGEMRKRLVGNLSKGYKQRVGIAQALINEPEILILDEPTSGLDPKQIVDIRNLIRSFAKEHTVILSTHILPEVTVTCDRAAIMNRGSVIAIGTPNELLDDFKASSDTQIFAEIKGSKEKIENIVKNFSHNFSVNQKNNEMFELKINSLKEDIRASLNKNLVTEGLEVFEIYSKNPALEEVFISLVTNEEGKQ